MARKYGTDGADLINGTEDDDFLYGYAWGSAGSDTGSDRIEGEGGNDQIFGGGGGDFLFGDEGEDIIRGGHCPCRRR